MLSRLLGIVVLVAGLFVATVPTADADEPICHWTPDGKYVCTDTDSGGDPGDDGSGDGGSTEPTCQLWGQFTYCVGTQACRNIPWHPPYRLPDGPKPQPDSEPLIRQCDLGEPGVLGPYRLTIYWSDSGEPEPPSLYEQALTAIGEIDTTIPALETSPDGRTLVYIPVWYWLAGGAGDRTGSSAFGLVATAALDHVEVDPGDGSDSIACPWVTSAEQAEQECNHTYDRASDDGTARWNGRPAHLASVTAVWNLSFEINGTPVTIPNAPATLTSEASTAPVRVDEQGSVVTDVR
ncbi:hypothetical protein [Nocardioides bizhenqiangii]|uniref:Uncharacterized protein n=1 Tax=Nocardioides bizhenqiangii TaxID=3095076 RepID=A0ABZ0ZSQ7_9ACTN|nr:hypothetical protein [Nocardioides sp. HM61]WQQ26834.1 hypothetical protein SHK19_01045 [Nocardioides sp. HM61]